MVERRAGFGVEKGFATREPVGIESFQDLQLMGYSAVLPNLAQKDEISH